MITVKMLLHAPQCSRTRSPIFSVGQVVTYYWPLPFVCLVTLGLRVLCIKLKFVIKLTPTLWIESPFSFFIRHTFIRTGQSPSLLPPLPQLELQLPQLERRRHLHLLLRRRRSRGRPNLSPCTVGRTKWASSFQL